MSGIAAYVAVGSNINPEKHVPDALNKLKKTLRVTGISTHYGTAPLENRHEQDDYLNGVWQLETEMRPKELKRFFRDLERLSGRIHNEDRYASRSLDLDLLLWDQLTDSDLGLPDPDVLTRPFLFVPLLELDPELRWPLTGNSLGDLVDYNLASLMQADNKMTEYLKGMING
jgi:2-amino-4-hydroxy-6-hydroxymethyldihydropteridine diphosphokinase